LKGGNPETPAISLWNPFCKIPLFYEVRFCQYFRPKETSSQVIILCSVDFEDFFIDRMEAIVIQFSEKGKFI